MNVDEFFANIILVGLLICTGLITVIWVRAGVISVRLRSYLREHNPDRDAWLAFLPQISPASSNPIRGLKYIYNDMDNDDPVIFKYKRQIRASFKVVLSFLGLMILLVVVAAIYATVWSKTGMTK